jgi:hypothetical protein
VSERRKERKSTSFRLAGEDRGESERGNDGERGKPGKKRGLEAETREKGRGRRLRRDRERERGS